MRSSLLTTTFLADLVLTVRLKEDLQLIEVRLEHFIAGKDDPHKHLWAFFYRYWRAINWPVSVRLTFYLFGFIA